MGGGTRAWGLGFAVQDDGYGMGGSGGSLGFPRGSLRLRFVTGTLGGHDRSDLVENAFREVIGLPPV